MTARSASALLGLIALACSDATPTAGRADGSRPDAGDASRDDARTSLPDAARALDAEPPPADGAAPGSPCQPPSRCAGGECLHGLCSVACARDADCQHGLACIERGTGRFCTPRCGATTAGSADACPPGTGCVGDEAGRGFCAAAGPGRAGDPCDAPDVCSSWQCAGGRCQGACDDATDCGLAEACVPLNIRGRCVAAGAGGDEAPCAVGADCRSGVCRGARCTRGCRAGEDCPNDRVCTLYSQLGLCERPCAGPADCGEAARCLGVAGRPLCVTAGDAAADAPCAQDPDCVSARCENGRCAARCAAEGTCPGGQACVHDRRGDTCRPTGATARGADCDSDDACATGYCAAGRCDTHCQGDADCAPESRCVAFSEGTFCHQRCDRDADCPGWAFCDRSLSDGAACVWRGDLADDLPCADHRQCWSGRCASGRCLGGCPDGRCPAGRTCRLVGAEPHCVAEDAPLPVNAACLSGETCTGESTCVAGRCLPPCPELPEPGPFETRDARCPLGASCVEGQCRPSCDPADANACRPGALCNVTDAPTPYCMAAGPSAPGAPCARSERCRDGLCLGGRCRASCASSDSCPDAEGCVEFPGGAWCAAVGDAPLGATCESGAECDSGLCLARRCSGPCPPDAACPTGTACHTLHGAERCVGRCAVFADEPLAACGSDEACAADPATGIGRCAAGGGVPAGGLCASRRDCTAAAADCTRARDGMRCRRPCRDSTDCPDGQICGGLRAGLVLGVCLPPGDATPLSPCGEDGDCADGRCETVGATLRCIRPCVDDAQCDGHCVDLRREPLAPQLVCAPSCDPAPGSASRCPDGLECRRRIDGAAACW